VIDVELEAQQDHAQKTHDRHPKAIWLRELE